MDPALEAYGDDPVRAPLPSFPIDIRLFRLEDEASVISLWVRCGLVRPWNDPHRDIQRKLTVRPEWFLVAVREGRVVGCLMAGYDGHRGWLNYLAVEPSHRRQGIARRLVAAAEQRLRIVGCPKVNLQVRTSNGEVLGFYRRIGYVVDDVVSLGKRLVIDAGPPSEPAPPR